jgi:hypothetical protein
MVEERSRRANALARARHGTRRIYRCPKPYWADRALPTVEPIVENRRRSIAILPRARRLSIGMRVLEVLAQLEDALWGLRRRDETQTT